MSETRIIQPPNPLTVTPLLSPELQKMQRFHRVGKIRGEAVAVPPSLLKGGEVLCEFSHV